MRNHSGQSGFTLIEILIVVGILGILAAVAALGVPAVMMRTMLSSANTEAQNVHIAAVARMADTGDWPADSDTPEFREYFGGGTLRAVYLFDDSGLVEDTDRTSVANPWPDTIGFDTGTQQWQRAP